jgi:hypothetical protein
VVTRPTKKKLRTAPAEGNDDDTIQSLSGRTRNAALMKRLLCIIGLLAVAPVRAEEPVTSLRNITRATMIEGLEALRERDYPKAQSAFQAAQALLDQQPLKADSYEDRATRAAIAYVTAKAVGEGKLGDPCPILITARAHVDSAAKLATKTPTIDHMREIGREADADIKASSVKFGCTKADPAEKGSIPANLAGHYYLSGVMETGSELMLKPDGAYHYFISYGAMDQFSQGTWQLIGDAVVLTHTQTPTGGPLFKLDSLDTWDADAEDYLRTAQHEARVAAVEAVCPFLAGPSPSGIVPPPVMIQATPTEWPKTGDEPKVDLAPVYARAKAEEAKMRAAYEQAAQAAMALGNKRADRDDAARLARYEWQSASVDLSTAHEDIKSSNALPPEPVLPSVCQLPIQTPATEMNKRDWVRGFGVIVGDPVAGAKFSNVNVRFHFADGKSIDAKTQRRGFAWVEKQAGNAVIAISVRYARYGRDDAPFERFAITNGTEGVQRVIIDSRQLVQPPFDEMRLVIEGDALAGPGGRGRYTKRD